MHDSEVELKSEKHSLFV